jgi:hypothetical protein
MLGPIIASSDELLSGNLLYEISSVTFAGPLAILLHPFQPEFNGWYGSSIGQ